MLAGVLLLGPRAQAQSPGTALLVRTRGDDAVIVPLRAELKSYRFRVLELTARSARSLGDLAAQHDAQAALRAVPGEVAVELWLSPLEAATEASDEIVRAGPAGDVTVLALRITEVMRARGLQLPKPMAPDVSSNAPDTSTAAPPRPARTAPAPAASETVAPAQAQAQVPVAELVQPQKPPDEKPKAHAAVERPMPSAVSEEEEEDTSEEVSSPEPAQFPWLHGEAAAAGIVSPADHSFGPSLDLFLQLRVQPLRRLSLSLFGIVPLAHATLDRAQGSADLGLFAIGGFADVQLPVWQRRLLLSAGLGGAALLTSVTGTPSDAKTLQKHSEQERTAALLVRAGVGYAFNEQWRVNARVLFGYAVPALQVTFGERDVASWGQPLMAATLGLEWSAPWLR